MKLEGGIGTMGSDAQSSVEYLMVFGWAFVVIIIMVVGLAILVNPSGAVEAERCTDFKNLLISNFHATDDNFSVLVVNSTGRNIRNIDLALSGKIGAVSQQKTLSVSGIFNAADSNLFVIPYSVQNVKGKYEFDVSISFTDSDNIRFSENAKCSGRVLASSGGIVGEIGEV